MLTSLPDISIIVCTRNRAHKLLNTLDSLASAIANVKNLQVEAVIVNNGSTDNTQAIIDTWSKTVSFPVQAVLEAKPGLSRARNQGILHSKGELIVFTDDDCLMNDDYLICLRDWMNENQPHGICGGMVQLGDVTDLPFSILVRQEKQRLHNPMYPSGFIIGANMVFPRIVLETIGNFDERFGAGAIFRAGEESDLIYRAYRAGITVDYLPDLIVRHFHGRKEKTDIRRISHDYFLGAGAMYAKHITDKFLLRHFYWDFKNYLNGIFNKDVIVDKQLGITYGRMLQIQIAGMAFYFWVWLCSFLFNPFKAND